MIEKEKEEERVEERKVRRRRGGRRRKGGRGDHVQIPAKYLGTSLVPRPSLAPVFDRLQYAKTEGEGLVNLTT